ncbi:DUF6745 domain-containing protein [Microbispora amethystogenes]|uniref:DUF6745 domain-containing protein n=1 Tax=Microbispora amethystogenes TaxID=1427754 RepID=UPI00340BD9F1
MNAQAPRRSDGVLTEEHEALIADVRATWTEIGLSTDPADRSAAERAVREAYAAMRSEPPGRIVWAGSPVACLRACVGDAPASSPSRLRDESSSPGLVAELRRELRRRHRSSPWSGLEDRLARRLRDELGTQAWDELRTQIAARLREPLWHRFGVRLRGPVLSRLDARFPSLSCGHLGGVQDVWRDAYWIALYTCALRVTRMRDERLEAFAAVARHVGWWIPSADDVVLSERPAVLRRDEQERLHSATGPALSWPDGHALHAWHGTPVPGWVITDPAPEAIRREDDPEIRRCAAESSGREHCAAGSPASGRRGGDRWRRPWTVTRRRWSRSAAS